MDEQQDWRLLRASENATHTVMVVVRDLSTCDDKDMPIMVKQMKCSVYFRLLIFLFSLFPDDA